MCSRLFDALYARNERSKSIPSNAESAHTPGQSRPTKTIFDVEHRFLANVNERILTAWESLERSAVESNAFLSPRFLLPAFDTIARDASPELLLVWSGHRPHRVLVGLGVFDRRRVGRIFPVLRGFQTEHSYLSGLLLHPDHIEPATDAIFRFLADRITPCSGIEFRQLHADGDVLRVMIATAQRNGFRWIAKSQHERAEVRRDMDMETLRKRIWRKSLRSKLRKLQKLGDVHFELTWHNTTNKQPLETFLELENRGWKLRERTSLHSDAADEQFFRGMMDQFSHGKEAFVTQLKVGEQAIAASANVISGNTAFALKIGWDPEFARYSPGRLHEAFLVDSVFANYPKVEVLDSCADANSYLNDLWPGRRSIVAGVFAKTPTLAYATRSIVAVRQLLRNI